MTDDARDERREKLLKKQWGLRRRCSKIKKDGVQGMDPSEAEGKKRFNPKSWDNRLTKKTKRQSSRP